MLTLPALTKLYVYYEERGLFIDGLDKSHFGGTVELSNTLDLRSGP